MKVNPIKDSNRIISLDVLRGVAILGILIVNIQSFSMPGVVYLNPTGWGDFSGINKIIWILTHLLADSKFMAIFLILFGAGIVLFTDRIDKKGLKPVKIHFSRTFWLLVFGLIHAYLIWHGDILVSYSICGFLVVFLRKKKPVTLLIIGLSLLLAGSFLYYSFGKSLSMQPEELLNELLITWSSTPELIAQEIELYQNGNFLSQIPFRFDYAFEMQTTVFFYYIFWRTSGLMLIGMSLFKWGILSAKKSKAFYIGLIVIGLGLGYSIILLGLKQNFQHNFQMEYSFFIGSLYNYWGSIFVSIAYISIVMLFVMLVKNNTLLRSLKAVGQMALTNYIIQSIICTLIFYGHGLGAFAKVERPFQILIVIIVLLIQMVYSPIWLNKYKFGPFEWAWRSLTYWRFQSMKKG